MARRSVRQAAASRLGMVDVADQHQLVALGARNEISPAVVHTALPGGHRFQSTIRLPASGTSNRQACRSRAFADQRGRPDGCDRRGVRKRSSLARPSCRRMVVSTARACLVALTLVEILHAELEEQGARRIGFEDSPQRMFQRGLLGADQSPRALRGRTRSACGRGAVDAIRSSRPTPRRERAPCSFEPQQCRP